MKHVLKSLYIVAIVMTVFSLSGAHAVATSYLPYSNKVRIALQQNCVVIKKSLTDLRKRDISSRVSRVYVYNYILQRTEAFATRLSNNGMPSDKVSSQNKILLNQLNKFKDDYSTYDSALTDLSKMGCDESREFHEKLQLVRNSRSVLADDVDSMQSTWQTIAKYISDLDITQSEQGSER